MRTPAVRICPEYVIKSYTVHYDRIWCDRCSAEITDGEDFPPRAELWISVTEDREPSDPDQDRWRRDYCPPCLEVIKTEIKALFGESGLNRKELI